MTALKSEARLLCRWLEEDVQEGSVVGKDGPRGRVRIC